MEEWWFLRTGCFIAGDTRGGEERLTRWWRTRSVHHAGGDSQRGADGREDADDGLDNKLPGLFLGHGCGELVNE